MVPKHAQVDMATGAQAREVKEGKAVPSALALLDTVVPDEELRSKATSLLMQLLSWEPDARGTVLQAATSAFLQN